ncbi:MAG: hypothetical protein K6G88_11655 [Lachnospiraceae bacterium]|nr:hypothetical protein [Lachnospiraceae bacterium]
MNEYLKKGYEKAASYNIFYPFIVSTVVACMELLVYYGLDLEHRINDLNCFVYFLVLFLVPVVKYVYDLKHCSAFISIYKGASLLLIVSSAIFIIFGDNRPSFFVPLIMIFNIMAAYMFIRSYKKMDSVNIGYVIDNFNLAPENEKTVFVSKGKIDFNSDNFFTGVNLLLPMAKLWYEFAPLYVDRRNEGVSKDDCFLKFERNDKGDILETKSAMI